MTIGRIGWEQPVSGTVPKRSRISRRCSVDLCVRRTRMRGSAAAAHALGEIAEESRPALPELVLLLGNHAAEGRLAALRAFPRIGNVPGSAQARVIELLKDPDAASAALPRGDSHRRTKLSAGHHGPCWAAQ